MGPGKANKEIRRLREKTGRPQEGKAVKKDWMKRNASARTGKTTPWGGGSENNLKREGRPDRWGRTQMVDPEGVSEATRFGGGGQTPGGLEGKRTMDKKMGTRIIRERGRP